MRNEIAGKDERKEAVVMITIGLLPNSFLSANYRVDALSIANIGLIERCCKRNNIWLRKRNSEKGVNTHSRKDGRRIVNEEKN